jgi:hypothetical protein
MTDAALVAVLDGAEGGRRIHIAERPTGRGDDVWPGSATTLEMSRAHAVFSDAGWARDPDLGSLNGTW